MTEWYFDENWNLEQAPATNDDLARWANAYQRKYFPECTAEVKVGFNTTEDFPGAAAFDPTTATIHIASRLAPLECFARIALLHEMIHVQLYAENGDADQQHGSRFEAEVSRLCSTGAYNTLL